MASIIKADTLQSTTSNVFVLNSAGTEYARFNSTGNLGIGTASPGGKVEITAGTGTGLYINQSGTTGNGTALYIKQPVGSGYAPFEIDNSSGSSVFQVESDGRITLNGGGIVFPATQITSANANTLDDYEEGTWTPSVTGSTSGGPFTFGTSQAYYTKIGREVKLSMFMAHNSTVTFAGAYKIGNFPFATANYGGGGFVSYIGNWISNSPVMFQIEASTTYGYLRMKTSANPETMFDLNSGLIQNNTSYMLTILYMTTT